MSVLNRRRSFCSEADRVKYTRVNSYSFFSFQIGLFPPWTATTKKKKKRRLLVLLAVWRGGILLKFFLSTAIILARLKQSFAKLISCLLGEMKQNMQVSRWMFVCSPARRRMCRGCSKVRQVFASVQEFAVFSNERSLNVWVRQWSITATAAAIDWLFLFGLVVKKTNHPSWLNIAIKNVVTLQIDTQAVEWREAANFGTLSRRWSITTRLLRSQSFHVRGRPENIGHTTTGSPISGRVRKYQFHCGTLLRLGQANQWKVVLACIHFDWTHIVRLSWRGHI